MTYTSSLLPPLILASASPRRRDLLKERGLEFTVHPAEIEEIAPGHLSPGEIVLRNARAKAAYVAQRYPDSLVVGIDTEVAFEGEVFGKPRTMSDATAMLARLNGQTHCVYSGMWLIHAETGQSCGGIERTEVHFHQRTPEERAAYLARIQPLDKAGAYAAQDDRGVMIRRIEGSFSNVIGLPMERLEELLERFR